jgi:hypothetical protein
MDDLAAPLARAAQIGELPSRRRNAELLLKFAAGDIYGGFIVGELALRYGPCAVITSLPKRAAGVHQKYLGLPDPSPVQNQARTLGAQRLSPETFSIAFTVRMSTMRSWAVRSYMLFRWNNSAEYLPLILGVLIFLAPWVLGFSAITAMAWSAWVIGVLAFIISGSVLVAGGNMMGRSAAAH